MNDLLVSVIIPTFNSRKAVFTSIQSVISQTYTNIEIIVVNDSIIDTIGDELKYKFPFIKYYHDGINRGGGGARNIGISLSKGDFISFLDDDDEYNCEKIQFLTDKAIRYPNFDAYFGLTKRASSGGANSFSVEGELSTKDLPVLSTDSSLIRAKVFKSIKFFEKLRKFQDTQLHLELLTDYKCIGFNTVVALWNDDGRFDQITKLKTVQDYKKSIKALYMLTIFFIKKGNYKVAMNLSFKFFKHVLAALYKLILKRVFR